jgi:hypothetical protein
MKQTKIGLTLFGLILATFCMSCTNSGSNNTSNANAGNVSNANTGSSPIAIASPTPQPPGSGSLVDAAASGDISYQLSGAGDNSKMKLTVRNKTERVWEVKIEEGTKLEPSEGGVQEMVITKEYEVHLEPHEHRDLEIEVSCLDINKEAPGAENKSWRIKSSQQLADFIKCANAGISELERSGQTKKSDRAGLLQYAIWKARGATRDDFIHLETTYGGVSEDEAARIADEQDPFIVEAIKKCHSLVNLGP